MAHRPRNRTNRLTFAEVLERLEPDGVVIDLREDAKPLSLKGERERMCERKVPMGWEAAHGVQAKAAARGKRLTVYRCPFGLERDLHGHHYHVGHPISLVGLYRLAAVLRWPEVAA